MLIRNVLDTDVGKVRALVQQCKPLTLHTAVSYAVLFRYFPNLCFVAEDSSRVVGYISGIRSTAEPSVAFVWQIGILSEFRGQRLSKQLIAASATAARSLGCTKLQVSIEDENPRSLASFRTYARSEGTDLRETGQIDFSDKLNDQVALEVVWEMSL